MVGALSSQHPLVIADVVTIVSPVRMVVCGAPTKHVRRVSGVMALGNALKYPEVNSGVPPSRGKKWFWTLICRCTFLTEKEPSDTT
jgi:hypothetical protein